MATFNDPPASTVITAERVSGVGTLHHETALLIEFFRIDLKRRRTLMFDDVSERPGARGEERGGE